MEELNSVKLPDGIEFTIVPTIGEDGRQLIVINKYDAIYTNLLENILIVAILQYRLHPLWIKSFECNKINKIIREGFNEKT